jgi:MoxR-like ATPase
LGVAAAEALSYGEDSLWSNPLLAHAVWTNVFSRTDAAKQSLARPIFLFGEHSVTHNTVASDIEITNTAKALSALLATKVLGQASVIEQVVVTVLSGGHALLTGAPGVAKTTLVRNLASSLGCGWKRIQFTPDLTPFDILGGDTIAFDDNNPDLKKIVFAPGPIFAPFLLADEINRASPRTQSALLEAMQEKQVTLNGKTQFLPKPFFVFATQNPIESEGTFPLPEAQLDRFLLNIEMSYPDFQSETEVANLSAQHVDVSPLIGAELIYGARASVEKIAMSKALVDGAVRIVRNTRPRETQLSVAKNYLEYGASPRASQALVIASKALALLRGASEVEPAHIHAVAPAVLRHRCLLNFKALSEKKTANSIVEEIISETVL